MSEEYAAAIEQLGVIVDDNSGMSSIHKANAQKALDILESAKRSLDQKWKPNDLEPKLPSKRSYAKRNALRTIYGKFREDNFTNTDLRKYIKKIWVEERDNEKRRFSDKGAFFVNWAAIFYDLGLLDVRYVHYVELFSGHPEYKFRGEAKLMLDKFVKE